MNKTEQRRMLRAARDGMSPRERQAKSEKIAKILREWDLFGRARSVMTYISIGSEVSTELILEGILADGKIALVPRISEPQLEARIIISPNEPAPGAFGVPEPPAANPAVPKNEIDLVLVPGLGFDAFGHRIGYGKGCYDRFLDGFTGEAAGLCYGSCLVQKICSEPWDQRVGYVITEDGIIKTGG